MVTLAIEKKCGVIDFGATLRPPHGANLAALTGTLPGADTLDTLATYVSVLRREHDCAAEDLLRAIAPRAEALLRNLAPSLPIPSASCAAP